MERVISFTAELSKQSGILIQLAKMLKKIYQFYKFIQKKSAVCLYSPVMQ
jgi:hypothetical protein